MKRDRLVSSLAFALGEGRRNASSSHFMGLLLTLLSMLAFAGAAVADELTVAQLAADEAAWISAGGQVLAATNPDGLSALACEQLNQASGIRAAVGVVRLNQRAGLASAPDVNLTVVGVTAGVAGFLPNPPALDSVMVTDRTAQDYGLTNHQWVSLRLKSATQQGAADNVAQLASTQPGDRQELANVRRIAVSDLGLLGDEYASGVAMLIPASGEVDACMVWAEPGAKATLREALPGVLPGSGSKPTVVADRLISGEFARDYYSEYLTRSWRWVPIAVGVGIGLVWILIRVTRRNEDGLYQSLGTAAPQRALLRAVEWTIYSVVAAFVAMVLSIVGIELLVPSPAQALPHLLRSILLSLASSMAVGSLAGLLPARNPLDALKDR